MAAVMARDALLLAWRSAMLACWLGTLTVGTGWAQTMGSDGVRGAAPPSLTPTLGTIGSVGPVAVVVLPASGNRMGLRISNNALPGGTTLWCSDVLGTTGFVAGGTGSFPVLAGTFYEGPAITSAIVCGTVSSTVPVTVEGW